MKEVMDNTVTVIKNTISATPIDKDRLVVGTEDGLFCVDLERDGKRAGDVSEPILTSVSTSEISRVGDGKKIYQVEYLQEEQLIIVLAGRHRQMRLIPIRALDQTETEWIKVADTKNCIGNQRLHLICLLIILCLSFSVRHGSNAAHAHLQRKLLPVCGSQAAGHHLRNHEAQDPPRSAAGGAAARPGPELGRVQ